jgi:hypothetical protein
MSGTELRRFLGLSLFEVTLVGARRAGAKVSLEFSATSKQELVDYLDGALATAEGVESADGRVHRFRPFSVTWCRIELLDDPGVRADAAAGFPKLDKKRRDPRFPQPHLWRPTDEVLAAAYNGRRYADVSARALRAEARPADPRRVLLPAG